MCILCGDSQLMEWPAWGGQEGSHTSSNFQNVQNCDVQEDIKKKIRTMVELVAQEGTFIMEQSNTVIIITCFYGIVFIL